MVYTNYFKRQAYCTKYTLKWSTYIYILVFIERDLLGNCLYHNATIYFYSSK